MNELIKYEQPKYNFDKVEAKVKEVTEKLSKYNFDKLVINEENKKEFKELRSKFNKEFEEYENFRKEFKNDVLVPYVKFEEVYKPLSNLYKKADDDLKNGIKKIEEGQKEQILETLTKEFEKQTKENNLNFLTFEQTGIAIKLSDSKKSRIDSITSFVNGVKADVDTINTLEHKERVRVEYEANGLNLANAITSVNNAIEKENEMKRAAEEKGEVNDSKIQEVVKNEPKINFVAEEFEMTFKVKAPKTELAKLKEFMVSNHIKFEGVR